MKAGFTNEMIEGLKCIGRLNIRMGVLPDHHGG